MGFAARFGRTNRLSPGEKKIIGVTVRLYAHKSQYNTVVIKRENIHARHWTADNISLFYSPHKFQQLFHTVVYMHLRANGRAAARLIAFVIHRLDLISSEAPKIVHWNLGSCILRTNVTGATTLEDTVADDAYRSLPIPLLCACTGLCTAMTKHKSAVGRGTSESHQNTARQHLTPSVLWM